jgi:hypothetical protein
MKSTKKIYAISPVSGDKVLSKSEEVDFSPANRLSTLEGKTVYLVDTGFGGSAYFMLALQKWFSDYYPTVRTVRKRKPGNVFMEDENCEKLWKEISEKGDAAILGVAG